jgi:hypothetical protein
VRRAYLLQKDDPAAAIRGLEGAMRRRPDSFELVAYLYDGRLGLRPPQGLGWMEG